MKRVLDALQLVYEDRTTPIPDDAQAVKFGSSSLTIPIRDSQHSGKECVLSLGRSPVAVAMAWIGGLALLSARSLAMPMRGLGCP